MKTAKEKERELIINLQKKNHTTREIASILDISKSKASFWIKRFRETKSLKDKPKSGCPSMLKKNQFKKLKEDLLDFPPPRFGGKSFGWTTKMAIQYVKDTFGVKYSIRRMQELFHKFGLSLITPRTKHKKSSKAVRIVYRMDFKKNSKKNIWIAPSLISTKLASD